MVSESPELVLRKSETLQITESRHRSYLELFNMFFHICYSCMGQICAVVNMRKLFRKFEPALNHHIKKCLDTGEFGLPSRPYAHAHRHTRAVHSPSKRIAVRRALGKRIHKTLSVRFLRLVLAPVAG